MIAGQAKELKSTCRDFWGTFTDGVAIVLRVLETGGLTTRFLKASVEHRSDRHVPDDHALPCDSETCNWSEGT